MVRRLGLTTWIVLALCTLGLVLTAISNAHATQTVPNTLAFYLNNPTFSITAAGEKVFDQWAVGGDSAQVINPNLITITPLHDGGLDPGPGLQFTADPIRVYRSARRLR